MKRLWLAGVFLVLVAAACVSSVLLQRQQVQHLNEQLNAVERSYVDGQTDQCLAQVCALIGDYDRHSRLFSCFIHHSELESCRQTLALLPVLLEQEEGNDFRTELERCRAQLDVLYDLELPDWPNIL